MLEARDGLRAVFDALTSDLAELFTSYPGERTAPQPRAGAKAGHVAFFTMAEGDVGRRGASSARRTESFDVVLYLFAPVPAAGTETDADADRLFDLADEWFGALVTAGLRVTSGGNEYTVAPTWHFRSGRDRGVPWDPDADYDGLEVSVSVKWYREVPE